MSEAADGYFDVVDVRLARGGKRGSRGHVCLWFNYPRVEGSVLLNFTPAEARRIGKALMHQADFAVGHRAHQPESDFVAFIRVTKPAP